MPPPGQPGRQDFTLISDVKERLKNGKKEVTKSVEIQLLKNGSVEETATLSEENGWTHEWTGLSKEDTWTVAEVNVADGYTDSYDSVARDGIKTITVTNTYKTEETGGTDEKEEDIRDPEIPLTPGTDPEMPVTPDTAVPDTEIPEEESPKAEAPETCDISALWLTLAALSGGGLAAVSLRKKREEE